MLYDQDVREDRPLEVPTSSLLDDPNLGTHLHSSVKGRGQVLVEERAQLGPEPVMEIRPDCWVLEVWVHAGEGRGHRLAPGWLIECWRSYLNTRPSIFNEGPEIGRSRSRDRKQAGLACRRTGWRGLPEHGLS